MTKRALITGVGGQDGAYLAQLLLDQGYEVFGTSRDASISRFGNLKALGIADQVQCLSMSPVDFRNVLQVLDTVRPDEIYNLSGQSSVGLSFQQPIETHESILTGTLNLLEVVRFLSWPVRLYFAGSSECFGDTGGEAAVEDTPFRPRSPYATAKAAAHWTVAYYRDAYGMHACNGILFNHESPLRPKRFVTRKIVAAAVAIARTGNGTLKLGHLGVSRDWGWAPEYVQAMFAILQHETPQDFVIATGHSYSLADFCKAAFAEVGLDADDHVQADPNLLRPSEILYNRGDASRARAILGWKPRLSMHDVVREMVQAEMAAEKTSDG